MGKTSGHAHFGYIDGNNRSYRMLTGLIHEAIKRCWNWRLLHLHELDLDHRLRSHLESYTQNFAPPVPLFHGHAVNIDMALSATIAENRGYITTAERDRILGPMSRIGLAFRPSLLDGNPVGCHAVDYSGDGLQREPQMPPIGKCFFVNDLTRDELEAALGDHKRICAE